MIVRKGISNASNFREPEAADAQSNSPLSSGPAAAETATLGDRCFQAMERHGVQEKSKRADWHFGAALIRQAKLTAQSSQANGNPEAAPIPGLDLDDDDLVWGARAVAQLVVGASNNAARKKIYYRYSQWKATRQGMPFVQFDNSNTICMSKRFYYAWLAAELKKSNLITV